MQKGREGEEEILSPAFRPKYAPAAKRTQHAFPHVRALLALLVEETWGVSAMYTPRGSGCLKNSFTILVPPRIHGRDPKKCHRPSSRNAYYSSKSDSHSSDELSRIATVGRRYIAGCFDPIPVERRIVVLPIGPGLTFILRHISLYRYILFILFIYRAPDFLY